MKFLLTIHQKITSYLSRLGSILKYDFVSGAFFKKDLKLTRLGSEYGGWVVPDAILDENSICYCVGCGEDISFDLEVISKFNCNIYAFDPTPRAISYVLSETEGIPEYNFYQVGIWDKEERLRFYMPKNPNYVSHSLVNLQKTDKFIEVDADRLSAIMKRLKHQHIDLLKLDIEGAEYKVLKSIIEDKLEIRIICVEFDEFTKPINTGYVKRIRNIVRKLINTGYSIAYISGTGEYTFIK